MGGLCGNAALREAPKLFAKGRALRYGARMDIPFRRIYEYFQEVGR